MRSVIFSQSPMLVLDGQAVCIPACLARHVVAAHRLVAREDVLEGACQHVMYAGFAVRRRRALVETEAWPPFRHRQRLFERSMLAPECQHLLFEGRPVISTGYFLERQTIFSNLFP
jgi:hypothetical protein